MANLIIKPQNTSGDKVIIQDQAGGAVLTTADSGATIANATLVTPNLGTPSAVTLTNATFPAGHIIQIRYMSSDTGYSVTNNNNWQNMPAWDLSITPTSASNKILYGLNTQIECRFGSTGGAAAGIQITRNVGGGGYSALADSLMGTTWSTMTNVKINANACRFIVDSPNTTSACIYRPQMKEFHGNTEAWYGNSVTYVGDGTWAYALEFKPH